MELDFSAVWTGMIMMAALVAVVGLVVLRRKIVKPSGPQDSYEIESARLTVIQFDVAELPVIRNLLGPETAAEILAGLASKTRALEALAVPPSIGLNSVTLSFSAMDGADTARHLIESMALLSEGVDVAGATFNCTVRPTILADASDATKPANPRTPSENRNLGEEDSPAFRMELLRGLQAGLAKGEVTLAYQPKLDLRSGIICSAEALLRWAHPGGQQVNIGDLVTLCEQTGTIRELTRWTAAKAIADNEKFLAAGHGLLIFINVSGSLLADVGFADDLLELLSQTPARIGIEITETAVIADPEAAISNLDRFAKAGIAIAIDDFGAGLASLEYLQRLPASELKIDRAFIAELSISHRNPLITRATIDLAHALDMRVTAEGVDDELSMALLRIMGCDLAQGYLISRPLDPLKFVDFLQNFEANADTKKVTKAGR
ncbi:MAG: EAL domain-containing protein [Sphingomonadales bacterium]|nr:EAL domain-containing protein [Sphingomonadales bacterium]NCQ21388.1 EAL domain-containing protein [Sphingomonadales bacterium]NCT04175.1 EAL domain-containing protein [Sphingomonadales bacterium]